MEVWIVRQPKSYIKCSPIDVKYIENIKWDFISGGVNVATENDFLYGYIPYEMDADLVDCSGQHREYNNRVKICILKGLNIRKNCKAGYEYCVSLAANQKRESFVSRN